MERLDSLETKTLSNLTENKDERRGVVLPLHARDVTYIDSTHRLHKSYSKTRAIEARELRLSLLVITFAVCAPALFLIFMEAGIPFGIAMPIPLFLLILSAHFQAKRVLISKKLYPQYRILQLGALVRNLRTSEEFVIFRVGIKHYYLRSLTTDRQVLVSFRALAESYLITEI